MMKYIGVIEYLDYKNKISDQYLFFRRAHVFAKILPPRFISYRPGFQPHSIRDALLYTEFKKCTSACHVLLKLTLP